MKTIKKTKEKKIKLTRHRRVIIKSSLRATITYNKKVANRFHDLKYYEVAAEEVLELPLKRHRKEEKREKIKKVVEEIAKPAPQKQGFISKLFHKKSKELPA